MREWTLRFRARRAAKCLAGSEGWCTIQRCCVLLGWAWLSLRSGGSKGELNRFGFLPCVSAAISAPHPYLTHARIAFAIVSAMIVRPASFGWQPSQVSDSPFSSPPSVALRASSMERPLMVISGVHTCSQISLLIGKVTRSREMLGE